MITKRTINELSYKIIGCAIEVHHQLGPGLLESIYEKCLLQEMALKKISFTSQQQVPIHYKGINLDCNLRFDILVEDLIIVELKAVDQMHPIYEAQLITYMKLLEIPKGILINFNCTNIFRGGQKTFVNDIYRNLPY